MRLSIRGILLGAAAFAVLSSATMVASADEGDVAYRKATMSAVGAHMKSMGAIVKGKVAHKDDIKAHARAMNDLSGIAAHIFPKGSGMGETKAKSAIWENPGDFKKALAAFQKASANMVMAADSGDSKAIGGALGGLGKSCKGCHSGFKSK